MTSSIELLLMLLADARLPTAGHTQSGGLEPALADGLSPGEIPDYIRSRLASVTLVEASTAVVALHSLRQGLPLPPVEAAWVARTPSEAMRNTSRHMAKGLLRLATRLWPGEPAVRAVLAEPTPSRGLAWAAVAAATRLPPTSLARLVAYDDIQSVTSAALKLAPLDPASAASWALEALPDADALALRVGSLTDPDDIPAVGAPQIEAWAEAHARTTRRLFHA